MDTVGKQLRNEDLGPIIIQPNLGPELQVCLPSLLDSNVIRMSLGSF
jgi:hypothetical protein